MAAALTVPTADLTGNTIADTYDQLLILDNAAGMVNSTLNIVSTQTGRSALQITNDQVLIKDASTVDIASCFEVQDKDGTVCLSVDGATNRVGIGTATPEYNLEIEGDASNVFLAISAHSATGGHSPKLYFKRSRGTEASPTVISDNDVLGELIWYGYDNDTYDQAAAITARTDAQWASNQRGTELVFATRDENESISENMIIMANGDVGIGTLTPISALEIEAGTGTDGAILTLGTKETAVDTADVLGRINFYAPLETGTDAIAVAASIVAYAEAPFAESVNSTSLQFQTGDSGVASTRMTIDEDGYVGIGTTQPLNILEVSSETPVISISSTASKNNWSVGENLGSLIFESDDINLGGDGAGTAASIKVLAEHANGDRFSMNFYTTEYTDKDQLRMTIDEDGQVGIGTGDPGDQLHVYAASGTIAGKVQSVSLANTQEAIWIAAGKRSGGSNRYAKIGVGDNDSSDTDQSVGFLAISAGNGNLGYLYFDDADQLKVTGTYAHLGTTSGGTTVDGADYSDERLKDISDDPFPYGLDTVNSLTPIKYKWKKTPELGNRFGFGAQTIQSIIPELISESGFCIDGYDIDESDGAEGKTTPKSDDNKLIMEYSQMHAILVKAIQELSAKVEALENA